jgi:hypothetical protein
LNTLRVGINMALAPWKVESTDVSRSHLHGITHDSRGFSPKPAIPGGLRLDLHNFTEEQEVEEFDFTDEDDIDGTSMTH